VGAYTSTTSILATDQYRIDRRPRPVPGEDTVFLPEGVIIDFSLLNPADPNSARSKLTGDLISVGPPLVQNLDILFAASGAILGPAGRTGKIILWVRDETQDPATPGEQTLITVFTRNGLIASYTVDVGTS